MNQQQRPSNVPLPKQRTTAVGLAVHENGKLGQISSSFTS